MHVHHLKYEKHTVSAVHTNLVAKQTAVLTNKKEKCEECGT